MSPLKSVLPNARGTGIPEGTLAVVFRQAQNNVCPAGLSTPRGAVEEEIDAWPSTSMRNLKVYAEQEEKRS